MIGSRLDYREFWAKARRWLNRRRLKRWGGYLLYAVVLAAVLLYANFPTDKLKERIVAEFEARAPGHHLTIAAARIGFGPSLRLSGVAVTSAGGGPVRQLFEADRVVLRPSLGSLLGGAPTVDYTVDMAGGQARGRLAMAEAGGKGTRLTANISKVEITRGELLKELAGVEMSGQLDGRLEAELGDSITASKGRLELEVSGGKIQGIELQALPVDTVKFKRFRLECDLSPGKLTLRRADVAGDINNKLSGVVELAGDLMQSKLDLRGTVSLSEYVAKTAGERSPKGAIAYTISGTPASPRFALDLSGGRGGA